MKNFECQHCGQLLYFENVRCERCGHMLGYLPDRTTISAVVEAESDLWRPLAAPEHLYRFCQNAQNDACNWMVPAASDETHCVSCRLNRTIPNLGEVDYLRRWQLLEAAKRRLVYSLLRLELPVPNTRDNADHGLAFDFLADPPGSDEGQRILTGHAEGLITINIMEADDAAREHMRAAMGEPYRTLLGHFRHETGHYYWDLLVRRSAALPEFRALFGDERADYAAALKRHYARGPNDDWRDAYVSSYASTHPWEDFAETWAHYLHIIDTLETAHAFGLSVAPRAGRDDLSVEIDRDPYRIAGFDELIGQWLPIIFAVNSLNRSMGQPDLYPFLLAPPAIEKLRFVHRLIRP